jgi:hypothetical protein
MTSEGATFFIRCARCGALYEAALGLSITTGTTQPYWTRPAKRRGTRTKTILERPVACDHSGPIERWDGAAWVPAPLRQEVQA